MQAQKNEMLGLSIMSLIISLIAFYSFSTATEDLKVFEKNVTFESYYYPGEGYKTKNGVLLELDQRNYTIPSIILSAFDFDKFKREIKKGDVLSIITDEDDIILQIKHEDSFYLKKEDSITLLNDNSYVGLLIGIIFISLSLFLLFKLFK